MATARATNRVVRSVSVRVGVRSCVVVESRGREWAIVGIATIVLVGLWFAARDLLHGPAVPIVAGITLGAVWLALAWMLLPWNARIVVDLDQGTCRVVWRWFTIPVRTATVAIRGRRFARGHGTIAYTKQVRGEEADHAAGCILGLILGPLAMLASPKKVMQVVIREQHEGIVLRDAEGSELLLAIADRASVDDALAIIGSIART